MFDSIYERQMPHQNQWQNPHQKQRQRDYNVGIQDHLQVQPQDKGSINREGNIEININPLDLWKNQVSVQPQD